MKIIRGALWPLKFSFQIVFRSNCTFTSPVLSWFTTAVILPARHRPLTEADHCGGVGPPLDRPLHISGCHHCRYDPLHGQTSTTTLCHKTGRPFTAREPPPSLHNSKTLPLPFSGSGPGSRSVQMGGGFNGCNPITSSRPQSGCN